MSNFPRQNQALINIEDKQIQLITQTFSDRHFILITENGKVGNLVQAWAEDSPNGGKIFNTEILLGKRDDHLILVYARKLIEIISHFSEKPLLLGICLKIEDENVEIFHTIINKLNEIQTWVP